MFGTIRDIGGALRVAQSHRLRTVALSLPFPVSSIVGRKPPSTDTPVRIPLLRAMSARSEQPKYACKYCQRRVAHTLQGLCAQQHGKCKAAYNAEMNALTSTRQPPPVLSEGIRATPEHCSDDDFTLFDPPCTPTPTPLEPEAANG